MGCGSANSIDNKVVIFLIGKPGCGQKLQGKKVSENLGDCSHIHLEGLIRHEMLRKSSMKLDQINENKLVPSKDLVEVLYEKICHKNTNYILIDGFPKIEENITKWKKLIGKKFKILALIHLNISNETMYEREKEKIEEMGKNYLEKKYKRFMENTVKIIDNLKSQINYFEINGEQSQEIITKEIVDKLKKLIENNNYNELF
jgi:adenylate kinase